MDPDFDLLCADFFGGEFDHFSSFDFDDFESKVQQPVSPSELSNSVDAVPQNMIASGSKRGRDDMLGESASTEEITESKQSKTDEELKDRRLKAITDLIDSLNQCENESFERLLREEYMDDVVVKLSHLEEDRYSGRNALLLIWVATHESYPDGMYKVLEKRYVNMTVPRGKSGSSPLAASPKVEFVYKFSGTKIVPGNIATLIRNFAQQHEDYATYGPEKLNDKLLQFVAMSDLAFEGESSENFIGEATLTFEPDSNKVKEVTFNVLAFSNGK